MSALGAAARLLDVEKRLKEQWAEARVAWRDEQARRFDEEIIQPLLSRLRLTERALSELSSTLRQVHRDCD